MLDELSNGSIIESKTGTNTGYLLADAGLFYEIGYKVMQNQKEESLLPCHILKYNGQIKFVYFTEEYKSLRDYIRSADSSGIITVLYNLFSQFIQIENNGFLNIACIDSRISKIYVDLKSQNTRLIYLPIHTEQSGSVKSEVENNLRTELIRILQTETVNSGKLANVIHSLSNGFYSLSECQKHFYDKDILENDSIRPYQSSQSDKAGVVSMSRNAVGIYYMQSYDSRYLFKIDKNEFLIGKNASMVDGVIKGNSAVSRVHCKIINGRSGLNIEDMNSSNGTFVDGNRLEPHKLYTVPVNSCIRIANIDFVLRG